MTTARTASGAGPGLRANARPFGLLVVVNAFVGAMVGLERTVLPLLAEREFGVASATSVLSFLVAFGLAKAFSNLGAGGLADRYGRRRLLVAGWVAAVPVGPMIMWAPSWRWVVVANVLLGVNQGLAWSSTAVMKVDLAGPRRRGLALALNESAGYGAVAVMAWVTGALAGSIGPRTVSGGLGLVIAIIGLTLSSAFVRETQQVRPPRTATWRAVTRKTLTDRTASSLSLAGMTNNLNDAMAWGLLPLYLAASGLDASRIGLVAATYPAVWTVVQLFVGPVCDRVGRKPLIVGGLLVQATGIAGLAAASTLAGWLAGAVLMGVGTAMVYPTLLAATVDAAPPEWRASALGVYRLCRDLGYVVGAVVTGAVGDALGLRAAIVVVAVVTGSVGVVVALRARETLPSEGRTCSAGGASS